MKSMSAGFEDIDSMDVSDDDIAALTFEPKAAPVLAKKTAEKKKAAEKPKKVISPAMQAAINAAMMTQLDADIRIDNDDAAEGTYIMLNTNNRMMAATAARMKWEDLALTGTEIDLDDGEENLEPSGEFEAHDLS